MVLPRHRKLQQLANAMLLCVTITSIATWNKYRCKANCNGSQLNFYCGNLYLWQLYWLYCHVSLAIAIYLKYSSGGLVPFQCPDPPDQVGGAERWAKPGSLEDSCPSNARARPTNMEAPSGPGGRLISVVCHWWSPSSRWGQEPFDGCWLVLLRLVVDNPNPPLTCSKRSKSSSD
jgi:hypothetical protein